MDITFPRYMVFISVYIFSLRACVYAGVALAAKIRTNPPTLQYRDRFGAETRVRGETFVPVRAGWVRGPTDRQTRRHKKRTKRKEEGRGGTPAAIVEMICITPLQTEPKIGFETRTVSNGTTRSCAVCIHVQVSASSFDY